MYINSSYGNIVFDSSDEEFQEWKKEMREKNKKHQETK